MDMKADVYSLQRVYTVARAGAKAAEWCARRLRLMCKAYDHRKMIASEIHRHDSSSFKYESFSFSFFLFHVLLSILRVHCGEHNLCAAFLRSSNPEVSTSGY